MLTRLSASAFVNGFDEATRIRWLAMLLRYEWPDDLPFFAPPPLLQRIETPNKIFRPVLTGEQRDEVRADPIWRALRDALYRSLPRDVADTLVVSHYMISLDAITEGLLDAYESNREALVKVAQAFDVFRLTLPERRT